MVDANCDTSSHISSQDFAALSNILDLSFIALLLYLCNSQQSNSVALIKVASS
jgi:hypothetical protein